VDKRTATMTEVENLEKTPKLDELKLLKLQNLRLRISVLDGKTEALSQRRQAIAIEMQVIPDRLEETKKARETLASEFTAAYTAAKKELNVPEGKELDLETGKIAEASPQQ